MNKRLRFFAYQMPDGVWVAHCVDLSLAAQGGSLDEVRRKIHEQVVDFCNYVNELDDPEFRRQLLRRRAPLSTRMWYWAAVVANRLGVRVTRSAPVPPKSWTEEAVPSPC